MAISKSIRYVWVGNGEKVKAYNLDQYSKASMLKKAKIDEQENLYTA